MKVRLPPHFLISSSFLSELVCCVVWGKGFDEFYGDEDYEAEGYYNEGDEVGQGDDEDQSNRK